MQIAPSGNQYLLMLMEAGKLKQLDHAKVVFPGNAILTDQKYCNLQFSFKAVPGHSQIRTLWFGWARYYRRGRRFKHGKQGHRMQLRSRVGDLELYAYAP